MKSILNYNLTRSSKRSHRSFIVLLSLAVLICLNVHRANAAIVLFGDGSCDGVSSCIIDNIDTVNVSFASENVLVFLRNNEELDIQDNDGLQLTTFYGVGNSNATSTASVDINFAFLDNLGNSLGQNLSANFLPSLFNISGFGNSVTASTPPFGNFLTRGLALEFLCAMCDANQLTLSRFDSIRIEMINGSSRVVSASEPFSLSLFTVGLIVLFNRIKPLPKEPFS